MSNSRTFLKKHFKNLLLLPINLIKNRPSEKFLIFGRGRSGSTLLCDLLNHHPQINCQGELLYNPTSLPKFKLKFYESINQKEAFGFKLLTYQCTDVQRFTDTGSFLQYLHKDGYKIIYLERTNILRQAISNIIAFQKGNFHQTKTGNKNKSLPHIPKKKLEMWLSILEKRKNVEQKALNGLPYLHLTYEEDLQENTQQQSSVNRITEYLNLSQTIVESEFVRIVSTSLENAIENFEEIHTNLKDSKYEHFLFT